ncbi:hypothetical protein NHQ30_000047 [Ciborinia camelliae]|nr:hypothetical protein NHQ30_000047 [Ciborinia camelliae]
MADQITSSPERVYPMLERNEDNKQCTPSKATTQEDLENSIPGSESIPRRDGEKPYGVWDPPRTYKEESPNKKETERLWKDVWRTESEKQICLLFDHVDLYRLAYITMVLWGSVDEPEKYSHKLNDIVSIFNEAGRPRGFDLNAMRQEVDITVAQVSELFYILASFDNPNRDEAFKRVLNWVWTKDSSPKIVLYGVPEAILEHFKLTIRKARETTTIKLRWEWHINAFIYEHKVNEKTNEGIWILKKDASKKSRKRPGSSEAQHEEHSLGKRPAPPSSNVSLDGEDSPSRRPSKRLNEDPTA